MTTLNCIKYKCLHKPDNLNDAIPGQCLLHHSCNQPISQLYNMIQVQRYFWLRILVLILIYSYLFHIIPSETLGGSSTNLCKKFSVSTRKSGSQKGRKCFGEKVNVLNNMLYTLSEISPRCQKEILGFSENVMVSQRSSVSRLELRWFQKGYQNKALYRCG